MTVEIGIHAATQGYTPLCKLVMDILPKVCLWLADTHRPENALNYPDALHVLRLRNPQPLENATAWLDRIERECHLRAWYDAPIPRGALVFQHANEPDMTGYDLPHIWPIDLWLEEHAQYLSPLRSRYPGIACLAPPFTCGNTDCIDDAYIAHYEGVAVHSYWAAGNPGWRQGLDGGASWRIVTRYNKPIYITELNSNPADANEILAWVAEVDSPLVLGATLYIAGSDSDPQYVVTPQMAAAIRVGLRPPQPPNPEPPSPPVQEDKPVPSYYSPEMDPLNSVPPVDAWVAAIAKGNPADAQATVDAYRRFAPVIRYDANLALAQAVLETGWFKHPRWTQSRNPAGIGITGDDVAGYNFGTIDRGVQSHLALLNCYYGNGIDPWGPLTEAGYGGFVLDFTRLDQMNGVWAVPGTYYASTISAIANEVTGGVVPEALPLPPPSDDGVSGDMIADEALTQLGNLWSGTYDNHNGNHKWYLWCQSFVERVHEHCGIFSGYYESAAACGRAMRALGLMHEGDTNPPRGAALFWDEAFWPEGGHTAIALGDGTFIGTTDTGIQIKGGWQFNAGYMGWAFRVGVGEHTAVAVIDPWETAPMVGDGFDDNEILRLWYGTSKPTDTMKKKFPYSYDHGIELTYRQLANGQFKTDDQNLVGKSIVLGKCTSKEEYDSGTPGRSVMYFESGKISAYRQEDGTYVFCVN